MSGAKINIPGPEVAKNAKPAEQKVHKSKKTAVLGPQVVSRPRVQLPAGYRVKAQLVGGASNGPVQAKVTDAPIFNGERLVEPGVMLRGTGTSTEDRLFIVFSQMVHKDGTSETVQAYARDVSDEMPGLKGSRVGSYALKVAGSIGLNFAGGLTEGLQETEVQGGVAYKKPSLKNGLLNASTRTALEESQQMMTSLKNNQPVIEVKNQEPVIIEFDSN